MASGKKKKSGFGRFVKRIFLFGAGALCLSVALALCYCGYLSGEVAERFSGRRWRIPSTVYSDTMVLFPGFRVGEKTLRDKILRLGYREKTGVPAARGECRFGRGRIELFLRDLAAPGRGRPGFPVVISFDGDVVSQMKRLDSKESVAVLELEPEEMMQFFGRERERRKLVSIAEVPKHLANAVLAAEDGRFYSHYGVDPRGILRAVYTNLRAGGIRQGGSTLTQQLAKNYFLTPDRTFRRKLRELFISLAIEWRYEKDEILEIYLNEIYFGQKGTVSVNGIGEAADFYFGKRVEQLLPQESAALAGMIRGPNLYSPFVNVEKCRERRNRVLSAMHEKGWLDDAAWRDAWQSPVQAAPYAPYLSRAPYFLDYVASQLTELYPETVLSSMGYGVYTTLDAIVQEQAEKALAKGLARLEKANPALMGRSKEKALQGVVIVMQPRTGNILAMVGGRDYADSQFNRAVHGFRQPGSCFKPVVVAAGLDLYRPSDYLSNVEKTYQLETGPWTPKNFNAIPADYMTVREMLKTSCNRAAVDLADQTGLNSVVEMARRFRFTGKFRAYPAIALGAFEVTPLELAAAYCALGADGVRPFPLSLRDVIDEGGKPLVRRNMEIASVISPAKAFLVTSMLRSAVEGGTGRALAGMGIDFPVAGKTGTTNDYRDAWFVGYTPELLALVWVGFDDGSPINATGGKAALPIWGELIRSIPGYVSEIDFKIPPGVVIRKICKASGELSIKGSCIDVYEEYFLEANAPDTQCDLHPKRGGDVLEKGGEVLEKFFDGVRGLFD